MKISLNCKLTPYGAYIFIKPLFSIKEIEKIFVFRDDVAVEHHKIVYREPRFKKFKLISQAYKLFQMFLLVPRDTRMSVGIYEIPHGLFAFIIGKIKKIPTTLCIISNPNNKNIWKGLRKTVTYFMLRRVNAITVTGSKSKKILETQGINTSKIHILPNSIDTEHFKQQLHVKKNYDIITLGSLLPGKNLLTFICIISLLKIIKPDIKVGIAGDGPERNNIIRKINELSLNNEIEFLGYIENVNQFYNKGKVFVSTSLTEGLPRTVIEAMACGIPCVVSNVGDMEDLIKNGINGFLIDDPYDKISFVNSINILLSDQAIYKRFSKKAWEGTNNLYSIDAAIAVWKNIIRDIVY